mgnify:CR=1 FL=1
MAGADDVATLAPRLTSSQTSVAVPPTMTNAPTTTNSLSILSSDSGMSANGGPGSGPIELSAEAADDGQRLDLFLASRVPQLSRSRLQALVREGHLRQGERLIDEPGHRVKPGERFFLDVPPPRAARRSRALASTSSERRRAASLSSTPFTNLWPSVPP